MLIPLRVLIADDDWMLSVCLKAMVESLGHSVARVAATGQQAVDLALAEGPDLVFMDVQMPVLDGLTATRRLMLAHPACVVVVSADRTLAARAEEAGAMAYAAKPICGPELPALIAQARRRFGWFSTLAAGADTPEEALRLWLAFRKAVAYVAAEMPEEEVYVQLTGTPDGRKLLQRMATGILLPVEIDPSPTATGPTPPALRHRPA